MGPITWEKVKLRACQIANLKGYDSQCAAVMVRKLHELFPECLPKDCKFEVFMSDKTGEWMVQ